MLLSPTTNRKLWRKSESRGTVVTGGQAARQQINHSDDKVNAVHMLPGNRMSIVDWSVREIACQFDWQCFAPVELIS